MSGIIKFNEYINENLLKGKSKEQFDAAKERMPIDKFLKSLSGKESVYKILIEEFKEFDKDIDKYDLDYKSLKDLFYELFYETVDYVHENADFTFRELILKSNLYSKLNDLDKAYILDGAYSESSNFKEEFVIGHRKLLKSLVDDVVDKNITEFYKLALATYSKNNDKLRELIETVDRNIIAGRNDYDFTLLDIAHLVGNYDAFGILLESGAPVYICDMMNYHSSMFDNDKELLKVAIKYIDYYTKLTSVDSNHHLLVLLKAVKPYIKLD